MFFLFFFYETFLFGLVAWQLRFTIDLKWGKLKNGIFFQAVADILTNLLQKFSLVVLYHPYIFNPLLIFIGCHGKQNARKKT